MNARPAAGGRRTRLLIGVVVVALLVAAGVTALTRSHAAAGCVQDERRVAPHAVPRVFDATPDRTDAHVRALVKAVSAMPLGRVIGSVGYDYGQWLNVGALSDGLATWTKRDSTIGMLGTDLQPRWGIGQAPVQHAWDQAPGRFLELELGKDRPLQITSYAMGNGARQWCRQVGAAPTTYTAPMGTSVQVDGDVVVMANGGHHTATLERLAARTGAPRWKRSLAAIDQGDFVGDLGNDVGIAGGRASYQLDPAVGDDPPAPERAAIQAFSERSGKPLWAYGARQAVHVVGTDPGTGRAVLQQDRPTPQLTELDRTGHVRWRHRIGPNADVGIFGAMVLVKDGNTITGLTEATGKRAWRRSYPNSPQFFPYGFELDSQPMLDADHLLLGATSALVRLDVRTGATKSWRLPTDGINTTYWPYQLTATPKLIVLATNTAAVAIER